MDQPQSRYGWGSSPAGEPGASSTEPASSPARAYLGGPAEEPAPWFTDPDPAPEWAPGTATAPQPAATVPRPTADQYVGASTPTPWATGAQDDTVLLPDLDTPGATGREDSSWWTGEEPATAPTPSQVRARALEAPDEVSLHDLLSHSYDEQQHQQGNDDAFPATGGLAVVRPGASLLAWFERNTRALVTSGVIVAVLLGGALALGVYATGKLNAPAPMPEETVVATPTPSITIIEIEDSYPDDGGYQPAPAPMPEETYEEPDPDQLFPPGDGGIAPDPDPFPEPFPEPDPYVPEPAPEPEPAPVPDPEPVAPEPADPGAGGSGGFL